MGYISIKLELGLIKICSLIFSCDQAALRTLLSVRPSVRPCQFAADDILLYEFCYYNPMDLLHHLEKGKEELSPLQYHINS